MTKRKEIIEGIMEDLQAFKRRFSLLAKHERNCPSITMPQIFALRLIKHNQHIGIKEVAEKLEITPSAATQLIDGLVAKGLVERQSNEADRRATILALTSTSKEHFSAMKQHFSQNVAEMFTVLSDSELEQFQALIKKVVASFMKERKTDA